MHYHTERALNKFWQQVDKTDTCWIWTGTVDRDGYGTFSIFNTGNRIRGSHRVSAWLDGRDPRGHTVCHTCDNPCCVNPAHLVVADVVWNNADKTAKGRNARFPGSTNHKSKLTEQDVLDIRADTRHYKEIAKERGLHPETIRMAKTGTTWRHI